MPSRRVWREDGWRNAWKLPMIGTRFWPKSPLPNVSRRPIGFDISFRPANGSSQPSSVSA